MGFSSTPASLFAVPAGGVYIFLCECAWPGEQPNAGCRTGCLVADIKTNVGATRGSTRGEGVVRYLSYSTATRVVHLEIIIKTLGVAKKHAGSCGCLFARSFRFNRPETVPRGQDKHLHFRWVLASLPFK